eukprot:s1782_g6.t1
MARWHDAMLGGVHEGVGLLEAYERCLRLVHALSGGPAMAWLEDRVAAAVLPERVRELKRDPMVRMVRDRLRSADEETAAILRHIFTSGPVSQFGQSIPRAIRTLEDGCGSVASLRQAIEAELRITEVWCEALDAPELPRLTGSFIRASGPVTPEEAFTLLTGSDGATPAPLFGLRTGTRWDVSDDHADGSACVVPSWCLDLVIPDPVVRDFGFGSHPMPLAVLMGDIPGIPKWITPQVVSLDQQESFIEDAVLRFGPSGATLWERDGEEVCLPSVRSVFLPSASMVANCVGPLASHSLAGQLASYETGNVLVTWPSCVGPQQPWMHFKSMLAEDEADDFTAQAVESGVCAMPGRRRRKRQTEGECPLASEAKSRRLEGDVKCKDQVSQNFVEVPEVVMAEGRGLSWSVQQGSTNLVSLAPKSKPSAPGREGVRSVMQDSVSGRPSSNHKDGDDMRGRSDFRDAGGLHSRGIARSSTRTEGHGEVPRRPRSPSISSRMGGKGKVLTRRSSRRSSLLIGSVRPVSV